jgi:hypothetical protein
MPNGRCNECDKPAMFEGYFGGWYCVEHGRVRERCVFFILITLICLFALCFYISDRDRKKDHDRFCGIEAQFLRLIQ